MTGSWPIPPRRTWLGQNNTTQNNNASVSKSLSSNRTTHVNPVPTEVAGERGLITTIHTLINYHLVKFLNWRFFHSIKIVCWYVLGDLEPDLRRGGPPREAEGKKHWNSVTQQFFLDFIFQSSGEFSHQANRYLPDISLRTVYRLFWKSRSMKPIHNNNLVGTTKALG